MPHRVIESADDLQLLVQLLGNIEFPLTVSWTKGRDRSLKQNALQFKWANECAQQFGDRLPTEVQNDWKLRIGVPILRAEDASFRAFYDNALKGRPFEEKLAAMEYVPVSSIMTVKQMRQYLDTVQRECLQNGVRLTDPAIENGE